MATRVAWVGIVAMCLGACTCMTGSLRVLAQTSPGAPAATGDDESMERCWSTYKQGAWVTLTSDTPGHVGQTAIVTHTEMTRTVQAISPESVTFRIVSNSMLKAVKSESVMKRPPVSFMQTTERHAPHAPVQKIGDEDVQAMGRTFKTQVYTMPDAGGVKLYMSEEVPGCTVKMQMMPIGDDPPQVLVLSNFGWQ